MAKTYPIDPNNPTGTSDPKKGDDQIRKTNAGAIEIINVDHYVGDYTNDVGYEEDAAGEHLQATLHARTSPVSVGADKGVVFTKTVDSVAELFYIDENDNETQITSNGALINSYVPVGEVSMHAGASAPTGFLLCQGQAVSRTTYAALFAEIGVIWGVGDGSTTFNIPIMNGRVPIGVGDSLTTGSSNHTLGEKEGFETHTLLEAEIPSHDHDIKGFSSGAASPANSPLMANNGTGARTGTTEVFGGGGSHNNLQPSLGINFKIKY